MNQPLMKNSLACHYTERDISTLFHKQTWQTVLLPSGISAYISHRLLLDQYKGSAKWITAEKRSAGMISLSIVMAGLDIYAWM